jgi:hypothetical protein
VPTDSSSLHTTIEPGVSSPSSLSQTPQHSDKENRESSDSEISSHNSPQNESPKTPPSPIIYADVSQQSPQFKSNTPANNGSFHRGNGNTVNGYNTNRDSNYSSNVKSSNNSIPKNPATNLPYPMLPPGVQVHQSPQSRTTFLYVTSKLPTPPPVNNTTPNNSCDSPPRHFSQVSSCPSKQQPINYISVNSPNNFKAFGGLLSNGSGKVVANEAPVQRDKLFLANASIRDKKVLPFLEQFGYGLPKDSNGQQNHFNGFSRKPAEFLMSERESNNNRMSRNVATVHAIPENFSIIPSNFNGRVKVDSSMARRSPPIEMRYSHDSRDRSPEVIEYSSGASYTPGGVLALALTRGSKAVMQASQFANNMRQQQRVTSPQRSFSESPDFGLDFSTRSLSPRNSLTSPNSTPRSTPGLSESTDDLMDDQNQRSEEENNNDIRFSSGGSKRRSSSSGGGPRKRSSLILEKYAQENPANPNSPQSTESILSQRLRLSSVIQYAEKCS